jgi:uncharacterized protein DUF6894
MEVTSITFPVAGPSGRVPDLGTRAGRWNFGRPAELKRRISSQVSAPVRRLGCQRRCPQLDRKVHSGGKAMPRYFFDLVDDKKVYDKKGVSLPNDKAAREYAKTFARELMETKADLLGESWQAWSVQVCNGKFDRILRIPFADVVVPKP